MFLGEQVKLSFQEYVPVPDSNAPSNLGQAVYMRFSTLVGLAVYSVNKVTERTGHHYE